MQTRTALLTGASRGLGAALLDALVRDGWRVVADARDAGRLAATVAALPRPDRVAAVPGDVADPAHRAALAAALPDRLDLLVNNASDLGPAPLPALADLPPERFAEILAVDVVAPLALVQAALPALRRAGGVVVDVSSDAAVEAYPGWGGYGAAKAALDRLTAVLAVEHPELRWYALDPGDMDTDMHRAADPEATGLPAPETVVPALLRLAEGTLPSGRYVAAEIAPVGSAR
jgi:NAD(P)-dependent dehydrogenase (short-subunit alcohol dehydrogenase family)